MVADEIVAERLHLIGKWIKICQNDFQGISAKMSKFEIKRATCKTKGQNFFKCSLRIVTFFKVLSWNSKVSTEVLHNHQKDAELELVF